MTTELTLFFALLRQGMGEKTALPLTPFREQTDALWRLAKKQDVAHILAAAPDWSRLLPTDSPLVGESTRLTMLAVYRCEQQQYALKQVGDLFEQAGISYLPLKGAVLRGWYPQPWLRTGCDVDILVHPEDLNKAAALLTEQLHCRPGRQGGHDMSFFTENEVHIELHYRLVEEGRAGKASEILAGVWERCHPVKGTAFHYEMPDELFYFYHLAHMAKHMEIGGCGVRFFLDLWMLEALPHSQAQRNALLQQGGLLPFAEACRRVTAWWFADGQPDDTCRMLQAYVFGGGVFGSRVNKAAAGQSKKGKVGYLASRLFPSRRALQWDYRVLQRHPYLLPVCWVARWCRRLFAGRLGGTLQAEQAADIRAKAVSSLLKRLKLQ